MTPTTVDVNLPEFRFSISVENRNVYCARVLLEPGIRGITQMIFNCGTDIKMSLLTMQLAMREAHRVKNWSVRHVLNFTAYKIIFLFLFIFIYSKFDLDYGDFR